MKKVALIATLVLCFGLGAASYAADAEQPKAERSDSAKEFISETPPQEFVDLMSDVLGRTIESFEFNSKNEGTPDYGIMIWVTNHGFVHDFFSIVTENDPEGKLVIISSERIGLVFVDENIAWYKSREVKKIYEAAVKAYDAKYEATP